MLGGVVGLLGLWTGPAVQAGPTPAPTPEAPLLTPGVTTSEGAPLSGTPPEAFPRETPTAAGLSQPTPTSAIPDPAPPNASAVTGQPQGAVTPEASPPPPPPLPPLPGQPPAAAGAPPIELELRADSQGYDNQLGRFVAVGHVQAVMGGGRLMADRLEFDTRSRSLYALGSVRFQRGQQSLQASRLRYSLLEGKGEMDDVYGVLDLDGSAQDFKPDASPSQPLPDPEPISCTPVLPPPPQWHPYPWAVSGWAGQMFAANFGDTFLFKGHLRPEYLGGVGLQRRLVDAGPFAFELDANLLGHRAAQQPGGEFNQTVPFADTPSQAFTDGTLGIGLRLWVQPWLSLYFVEGVSLLSQNSNYERTFRENYGKFLNYLAFEVEALVSPQWSAVGRIHHRSGAYGIYNGVSEGSNAYLIGLRYRFGSTTPPREPITLPPPQGCPGAVPPGQEEAPLTLEQQLEQVALGQGRIPAKPAPRPPQPAIPSPPGNVWARARAQEKARSDAIARLDQRVRNVQFEQSLVTERRRGFPTDAPSTDTVNQFGGVRPVQLNDLATKNNEPLLRGTISRWRLQARHLAFTPTTFSSDRIGFTNDPFTPAQAWLDSENVVATLQANGDTVIQAQRNLLRIEERLPIPVSRSTTIKKQEQVDNRWVLASDKKDRDGYYVGYNVPLGIGDKTKLVIQPQVLIQRAIDSGTDSYPLPGQSAGAPGVQQPTTTSDLFGLEAKLTSGIWGFDTIAKLDVSTFNPDNIANGTRSWGQIRHPLTLPLLGETSFRLFGAYRFRTWNGSLGEEDVYSAYGVSLDDTGTLPNWGRLSSNYYWRLGVANVKANTFNTDNLGQYWRGNGIGSLNLSLPLWTGKALPATPTQGLSNSPVPVIPGLRLNGNLLGTFAYYGDGTNQNTLSFSAGPTLTLGHFTKPFLDYTELTITGGATLRQGLSPLSFDRAVDLGTLGIGLTQQIAGPLLFSGGIGFNVDPKSTNYGDVTGSYVELRWQRRAYEIGIYYSPYEGLGGVRVKLHDFNFSGPGLPFVPHNPNQIVLDRPF